jgi:hypothetical protein
LVKVTRCYDVTGKLVVASKPPTARDVIGTMIKMDFMDIATTSGIWVAHCCSCSSAVVSSDYRLCSCSACRSIRSWAEAPISLLISGVYCIKTTSFIWELRDCWTGSVEQQPCCSMHAVVTMVTTAWPCQLYTANCCLINDNRYIVLVSCDRMAAWKTLLEAFVALSVGQVGKVHSPSCMQAMGRPRCATGGLRQNAGLTAESSNLTV